MRISSGLRARLRRGEREGYATGGMHDVLVDEFRDSSSSLVGEFGDATGESVNGHWPWSGASKSWNASVQFKPSTRVLEGDMFVACEPLGFE